MCKCSKMFFKVLSILSAVAGVVFVVYFWNLDQKLLNWVYRQVNTLSDRKKAGI